MEPEPEPEPEPEDLVPDDPDPEAAEPVPERESSCRSMSSRSLEVDMASLLDSLASPCEASNGQHSVFWGRFVLISF